MFTRVSLKICHFYFCPFLHFFWFPRVTKYFLWAFISPSLLASKDVIMERMPACVSKMNQPEELTLDPFPRAAHKRQPVIGDLWTGRLGMEGREATHTLPSLCPEPQLWGSQAGSVPVCLFHRSSPMAWCCHKENQSTVASFQNVSHAEG